MRTLLIGATVEQYKLGAINIYPVYFIALKSGILCKNGLINN